jgi:hypothetical protein
MNTRCPSQYHRTRVNLVLRYHKQQTLTLRIRVLAVVTVIGPTIRELLSSMVAVHKSE